MTTPQALRQLARCHATIAVNTWYGVNRFVTGKPWLALALVALVSMAVSAANIMSARAERDSSLRKQAQLQQQVEQLQIAAGAERSAQ